MDYFIARWYAVSSMSLEKLFLLHMFERALNEYAKKINKMQKTRKGLKTTAPLWWQEGARALNKEMRSFWLHVGKDCNLSADIKQRAQNIFLKNGIEFDSLRAFADITLMHKCDLALNSSQKPSDTPTPQALNGLNIVLSSPRPAIPSPRCALKRAASKKLP